MFDLPDLGDIFCLGHFQSSLPKRIILHLLLKNSALYSKTRSLSTVFKLLRLNYSGVSNLKLSKVQRKNH